MQYICADFMPAFLEWTHKCFNKKIFVPTLKEIQDDIPELALYFFKNQINKDHELSKVVTLSTFESLKQREWKNNIVELKNFIEDVVDDYKFCQSKGITDFNRILQDKITTSNEDTKSGTITKPTTFNTLKLKLPEDPTDKLEKVSLILLNDSSSINSIELSPNEASFIYYLAFERKHGEKYWLDEPDKHRSELKRIFNSLYLSNYFEDEINEQPEQQKTWIWDFKNTKRKTIKSEIHKKLKNLRDVDFKLIVDLPNKNPSRVGNYTLNSQIKTIHISDSPLTK